MNSTDKNLRFNMLASISIKPISLIISYIYVPFALSYLGTEKYGVWATILSILAWIGYFDIGIGNGLRNKLTESIANKDNLKSKKLISSAYAFIAVLMLCATICFCACASFIDWTKVFGVNNFDENLFLIVSISIIFIAINFIMSICKNIFYALQKSAYVSSMELLVQILNLVGVFIISKIGTSSLFKLAMVYGLSMLIVNIIFTIFLFFRNKEIIPNFNLINMKEGKELTSLGLQFFVIQICALVLFTTDNVIISSLFGAIEVTPYSTVNKLFGVIAQAFTALLAPVWASVTKAKTEKNYVWLKNLIKKLQLIMIPFIIAIVILTFIFRPISDFWLKQKLDYSNMLIIFGALYGFLTIWCNTFAYVANGLEIMKASMIVALIQAIINIPLSLFFGIVLKMGNAGVLCGTIISMAVSAIVIPILVSKTINRGIKINNKEVTNENII